MSIWGNQRVGQSIVATDPQSSDVSTRATAQQMIEIARSSASTPQVVFLLDSLLRTLPRNPNTKDLARAIFWWVKNHVRFVEDEEILYKYLGWSDPNQELLICPEVLVGMPQPIGDCDDFSMLVASLLCAAGMPCWFVIVAVDREQTDRWSHVYCATMCDGETVYMDCSHGNVLGWETPRQKFMKMFWRVN